MSDSKETLEKRMEEALVADDLEAAAAIWLLHRSFDGEEQEEPRLSFEDVLPALPLAPVPNFWQGVRRAVARALFRRPVLGGVGLVGASVLLALVVMRPEVQESMRPPGESLEWRAKGDGPACGSLRLEPKAFVDGAWRALASRRVAPDAQVGLDIRVGAPCWVFVAQVHLAEGTVKTVLWPKEHRSQAPLFVETGALDSGRQVLFALGTEEPTNLEAEEVLTLLRKLGADEVLEIPGQSKRPVFELYELEVE